LSILFFPVWVQAGPLETRVDALEVENAAQGVAIGNLQTENGAQATAIGNLQTEQGVQNGAISTLQANVATLQTTVGDLVNAPSSGNAQFVFVGVTTTKALGNEGMGRFSQLCFDEVSPESRFCNTKEVFESINPFPIPLVGQAWVHPTVIGISGSSIIGYSGAALPQGESSCGGWSSGAGFGMALRGRGEISRGSCPSTLNQIACCGPAQ